MLRARDLSTDQEVRRFPRGDWLEAACLLTADVFTADGMARRDDHGVTQTLDSCRDGLFRAVAGRSIALDSGQ